MTENVWLWIAQGLLAVAYGAAGFMKVSQPIPALVARMGAWPGYSTALTRFIGVAEVAAAIGMILPILLDILPWLTPLAAIGLSVLQVLAIGLHVSQREFKVLPANLVLVALSLFVAIGRFDLF